MLIHLLPHICVYKGKKGNNWSRDNPGPNIYTLRLEAQNKVYVGSVDCPTWLLSNCPVCE